MQEVAATYYLNYVHKSQVHEFFLNSANISIFRIFMFCCVVFFDDIEVHV